MNHQASETWEARARANQIGLGLWLLAFLPLLASFLIWSWSRPAYQFFPMALTGAGMLAWRAARESDPMTPPGNIWVTRSLVLGAASLFLAANVLWSPWLSFIAFLLGTSAVLWGLGGPRLWRTFAPVLFMLVIILPPPLNWDYTLTLYLRSVATKFSCALLDRLGVIQVQDGNTIQLPGRALFMEEACSGINSFVLCNALCLFWLLWQRRPLAWLLLAFPVTSMFVVMGNVLRIATCAAAYYFKRWDLLSGRPHEIFGLVLLLGYCGLVFSLDQLLAFFFLVPSPAVPKVEQPAPPPKSLPARPVLQFKEFKYAGVLLAVVALAFFGRHLVRAAHRGTAIKLDRELELSMPDSLAGWHRVNADSGNLSMAQTAGIHSRMWQFEAAGIQATVAVDYPLDGFHNVQICYVNSGWSIRSTGQVLPVQNESDARAIVLNMAKNHQNALVFHSVIDGRGDWLSAPQAVGTRFIPSQAQTGFRIQLLSTGDAAGYAPITPETESRLAELYFAARQQLVPQIVKQMGK